MYLLQGGYTKVAYAAAKAAQKGYFDSLLESPIFWGVLIIGGIIVIAIKSQNKKN